MIELDFLPGASTAIVHDWLAYGWQLTGAFFFGSEHVITMPQKMQCLLKTISSVLPAVTVFLFWDWFAYRRHDRKTDLSFNPQSDRIVRVNCHNRKTFRPHTDCYQIAYFGRTDRRC
jgi:purine-cytosine permease-like protein